MKFSQFFSEVGTVIKWIYPTWPLGYRKVNEVVLFHTISVREELAEIPDPHVGLAPSSGYLNICRILAGTLGRKHSEHWELRTPVCLLISARRPKAEVSFRTWIIKCLFYGQNSLFNENLLVSSTVSLRITLRAYWDIRSHSWNYHQVMLSDKNCCLCLKV